MNPKYESLFQPIILPNGVELTNRFGMAPMLIYGTNVDGTVGEEDRNYFSLRNNVGNLIISGAAAVSEECVGQLKQLCVYNDNTVDGLCRLANIMKEKGNKAILQLHNAGREAQGSFLLQGRVLAPSAIDFPFLDYIPEELSNDEILQFIDDYGEATRRAAEAGFDGVEIHGANHYLLQQFFSSYSNNRTDEWGGDTFETRMTFPIAVLKRVKEAATEYGGKDFIVGYRISPEEVHGETVGYTVDDVLPLIDKILEIGVDYIHVSSNDHAALPKAGGKNEPIAKTVYDHIAGRVPVVLAGHVLSPDEALEALQYCDIVALARAVLIDPDFVTKLETGEEDTIETSIEGRLSKLALPDGLIGRWKIKNTGMDILPGLSSYMGKPLSAE